jgi:hypothetical protein
VLIATPASLGRCTLDTGPFIETWVNEHHYHEWTYQLKKVVMAEYSTDLGHLNPNTFKHRDQPISMTEIFAYHKNMNMKDKFSLSRS